MSEKTICIGLISDTHMPARCKCLPDTVFDIFADVDLILHVGDVGQLWVLDELSQLAPVIAVHGNDETHEATQALPYIQTVVAAGHRIVLTHSHYPERAVELEMRKDDRWLPKLARIADFGRQHGAEIVIYGHTHIPMSYVQDGVHLINPGAIASGGETGRQRVRTVARLYVRPAEALYVEHIDLNTKEIYLLPKLDVDMGFRHSLMQYNESLLDPALEAEMDWFKKYVVPLDQDVILETYLPLAHRRWEGEPALISLEEFVAAYRDNPAIPARVVAKMQESAAFAAYL